MGEAARRRAEDTLAMHVQMHMRMHMRAHARDLARLAAALEEDTHHLGLLPLVQPQLAQLVVRVDVVLTAHDGHKDGAAHLPY